LFGVAPALSYTPALNYNGSDSFTFKVNDGQADSNVATISLAVAPVNDAPTANAQLVTTEEDHSVSVTLSGQDIDGDALTYRITSGPSHGVISGTAPQLTYTPARDFNGADEIYFVSNDGRSDSAATVVQIAVGPINDPPAALDSSIDMDEDTSWPLVLTATDPDGNALSYRIVSGPQHGVLTGTPPDVTYRPFENYAGADSFTFRASDALEDSPLATVSINVRQVNDAPQALEQNVVTTEDTARPIILSGSDVEGDALGFRIDQGPAHGTLSGTPPNIVYTPAANYNGSDSFTFRSNDSFEESDAATVTITIVPANDAPIASPQQLTTAEDTDLAVTLLASDVEDDVLSYTVLIPPQHGSLSGNAPHLTYHPAPNYSGPDSFVFRANDGQADSTGALMEINVSPVNDMPVADNQSITTDEDNPREIILTGSDVDGDALSYRILSGPSHGVVEGAAAHFTYTPATNYNGPDSFTFVSNDGVADSPPATVLISVGPINDAPVTYNQNLATDEDTSLNIALWADDYDGDPVTFRVVALPQHGTISGANGDLTYTPDPNYNGSDSFAYKANDGQEDSNVSIVTIAVRPVNDPPLGGAQNRLMPEDTILSVTLTAADVDNDPLTYSVIAPPTHGTLSGTPPNLTYTPAANFNGLDSFTFTANDGTVDSSVATVSITVQPVNDLPVGDNQTVSTDEDTPLNVTLSGSDVDGDSLTYFVVSSPQHGTVSGTPPQITYTPSRDYNGLDRIVFASNDGKSDSLPAEIQIVVRPVNDPPVVDAGPDQSITFPGIASLAGKAKDDGDPAGSTVSVTWTQVSGPGAVTFQAANALETRAAFSVAGVYVLRLSASDSELSSYDDITITVSPENHRPEVNAGPDQVVTLPDAALLQGTATDDGNPAGKTLITAWSVVSAPAPVSFSDRNNLGAAVSFNAVGTYILRLTASDTELSKSDDVVITVLPHNNPPVVNAGGNKSVELTDTLALTGAVTDDGLPAGHSLTISWTVLSGPGDTIIADPTAAATTAKFSKPGTYVLRLSANDSQLSASDQITVTVIQSNRPPTVDAGADQTLNLYNVAELSGTVTDDGLPNNTVSLSWTKVSGPGDVAFSAAAASTTTATFSKPGTYTVRLTADDSALTASDDVVITANFKNQAPEVEAGPDQTGLVQTPIVLSGSVTDDGLPADVRLVITWSKVSGPGTATFADPSADVTSVTLSDPGTYVLQLTASDSEFSVSDQVTVQVAVPCQPAPTGLVGFWPGDDDARDLIGGSNGVLVNGAGFAAGEVNDAFSLNGTNSVKVPATTATNVGTGNGFTVELWVNPVSVSQQQPVVEWNNGSTIGVHLWVSVGGQGVLYANIIDSGGGAHVFASPAGTITAGSFQHVALTYDKATGIAALYKNGNAVAQQSLGAFTPRTAYDVLFGERPGFHFSGKIDEVSLYNRALRSQEIVSIYQAGNGGKCHDSSTLNHGPVVSAGPDVTIPLSYSLALNGSTSDDGLPAGSSVTTNWTVVSGPGTVTFLDASSPTSSATFSATGTYVLRLTASDTDVTATSDVTITVVPDNQAVPNTVTITPFQAPDWHYKVYPYGTVPDNVGALNFDDSSYALGRGAFGSGGGCAVQSTVHTTWPLNTEIVLRRVVELPANVTNVRVSGTVDNDVQVFINGVAASGFITHENCPQLDDTRINVVTTSVAPGSNLFVVRGRDRGVESFLDVRLLIDQPIAADAGPSVTVAGGTSVTLDGSHSSAFSGAPLTYQWSQLSGPTVALDLTDPVHPRFIAPSFSTNTALMFRLIVSDGRVTSSPASVTVTVLASASAVNHAPTVDAGPDQTLVSSTAALHGTVQDDGLPANSIRTKWTAVSGPGAVTFADPTLPVTSAQFTRPGTYVLRLSADDSQLLSSDIVAITVPAGVNLAPSVNAGPDQTISSGNIAALAAIVSDDGLPNGALIVHWSEISGPSLVTFANAYAASTSATFALPGTYVLRITASDSVMTATDDIKVTILGTNQPPQVNAGADQTISVYNTATLGGIASDDGLPAGILNYRWSAVRGPGSVSFAAANDAVTATFSQPGTYVLRFAVSDSELSASDDVTIQVLGDNVAPVVSAGPNQTIRLTNIASLNGSVSDDGLPLGNALSISWQQISGPAAATFSGTTSPVTSVTFPEAGTYVLQLSASDGALTTNSTMTVTVTKAANLPPAVSISSPADQSRALSNTPVSLAAAASDSDGSIARIAFFVNGTNVGEKTQSPYSVSWSGGAAGSYAITAVATDNEGATATSALVSIQLVDNSSAAPVVDLVTPQDGAVITAPVAITGTIESTVLRSYVLQYRQKNQPCADWVTFASGTGAVSADTLGIFDPTLLLNGTYEIRLLVTTLNGASYVLERDVVVDGNMKVGQFTATFKDLELPLAGVPISVTRTYDSRNHCPGDFGYGWTLDVDSIRLESSETMGNAWSLFVYEGNLLDPSYYRMDDTAPHLLSVKLPDGHLLRFTPKLVMDRPYSRLASLLDQDGDDIGQVYAPIGYNQPVKLIYRAQSGTNGAVLKPRGYRTTDDLGGSGSTGANAQFYLSESTEGAFNLATHENSAFDAPVVIDVSGWELTLKDGRVFLFDANGKLEQMLDRVGNKVTFNHDAAGKIDRITHTPSGKEIVFHRDASSRIDSITDPAGNATSYRYTSNGDLDSYFARGNDPANNVPTTRFTYKGVTHLLENILDARGIQAAKNYYDDSGRLYKTVDADGKETIFTHDLNNRTETIKDRTGSVTVHKYDERGNIIETHAPDGTVTTTDYHRWSDGRLSDLKETESVTGLFTDELNPAGPLVSRTLTTHYSYEVDDPNTAPANDGLLRKLVDPKGNTTTFTYDERGNVLTVTDANANAAGGTPSASVANTYANGLLQTATDAMGHVTTYTYDAKGNPDTETRAVTIINVDGSSNVVSVVTDRDYNALGQLEKLTDPAGHVTTYEYDTNGNRRFERTTRTSGGGTVAVVTETEYDAQDRPIRAWNPDNPRGQAARPSSQTVYDDNGKVAWTYDALGRGTHQEYDSRGLLTKTTRPDNTFETVTYDPEGRREVSTDRRGQATKTVYDSMGRVKNAIFLGDGFGPAVTLSTTGYDAAGRIWQSTDANGRTTSYCYDAAGRRLAVVQPLLANSSTPSITHYDYDNNGNLRLVTDAKGRPIEHVYDALNRRIQTILPAAPIDLNGDGLLSSNEQSVVTSTQTGYDELGLRISETDASNRTKRYVYDVIGRLRHVVDFAGQDTRFEYDELSNQLSQTDANNHTTSYTYDNAGRRLTRTLPLGQQELLGYDDAGNLASRRDFNGRITTYGYDAMNRLRYRVPDSSLGEPTVEFTYTANGQRETMRDATGTTIYSYDGRGQLSTKQTPFGTLSYTYYPNGSLAQMWSSNANGVNVSYGYDVVNRLETVTDPNLGNTIYGYDEVGNLKQVLYPNNTKHEYAYSALNRLELLTDRGPTNTIINSWRYYSTGAGQRTRAEEIDGRTATYGYDSLGRLKAEAVTGSIHDGKNGNVTYNYDNVGNRLARTSSLTGIVNQSFGYDANDRLNGDQYDNNGNTKSAPVSQPSALNSQQILGSDFYDSENRLTQRNGSNGNITLLYDGDGNRVQEIINGQTTSYLVDDRNPTGYAQVVEETVNGSVNHTYTYGHDLISQDQVDPVTNGWHATFYAYDGHGNVRFLTNESGQVTDTYVYDAFGTLITAAGTTNNRYLYTGEQFEPALGLYYLRARLMNPLTGRFWSMDSHAGSQADPVSLHKYLYANADPANQTDPTGKWSLSEVALATYVRVQVAAMTYPAAFTTLRAAVAVVNVVAFVTNPEFREAVIAGFGPAAAGEIFAEDAYLLYRTGASAFRYFKAVGATAGAFEQLAALRQDFNLPAAGSAEDGSTLSKLEINKSNFFGVNGRKPITVDVNAISADHAEIDALNKAYEAGIKAEEATLYVDRAVCKACGQNGALGSVARQLGLKKLIVRDPTGTVEYLIEQ
jgi:RHS repeat-associated protein